MPDSVRPAPMGINAQFPSQPVLPGMPTRNGTIPDNYGTDKSPSKSKGDHAFDDVDQATTAHHHTLGYSVNQASPGTHLHSGRDSAAVPPSGSLIQWARPVGVAPPTGYLVANGQDVSRSTYGSLFRVIGTDFGPGDGFDTFTLPNLAGTVTGVVWLIKY